MVQQGLGGRYARAATRRGAVARDGEDASYPAARATVQAGLRSYALTKAEQLRFSGAAPEYREARCGRGAAAAAAGRRAEGLGRFAFSSVVVTCGWDVFVGKHKFASAGGTLPHARVAAAPVCSLLKAAAGSVCRNFVLGKWDADITRFLSEQDCLGGCMVHGWQSGKQAAVSASLGSSLGKSSCQPQPCLLLPAGAAGVPAGIAPCHK